MDGGRDKHSLPAHTVTLSPSLDKPNLLKAQNVCAASSSSALTPLDQLAWGQLWVQQLRQKGWWRTLLYLEICFIVFCFNLWTFGFWEPDPELWLACPHCIALQTLVQLLVMLLIKSGLETLLTGKERYVSSLPPDASKPHIALALYPSECSFVSRIWSHVVRDVSQDFLSGAKQTLSTIYLQYYAKAAIWYFYQSSTCFLPTYPLAYSEAFATYPEKITTAVRGYCLPETPKLRRANISQVTGGIPLLTMEISNLRLLEGWRTYRAKDHSAPLLIFCLHHWLDTGFRATRIFSLAQKACSYNK